MLDSYIQCYLYEEAENVNLNECTNKFAKKQVPILSLIFQPHTHSAIPLFLCPTLRLYQSSYRGVTVILLHSLESYRNNVRSS